MELSDYNKLIKSTLDDDFIFLFAPDAPPSLEQVNQFKVDINCQLPDEFIVLLSSYLNGFYAEAKEDVWPRKQGGAYWMFQYAIVVYGLDSGLPGWVNLRDQTKEFREYSNTNLTPFMRTISSSEPYCFTESGEIVKWDNDLLEANVIEGPFFSLFKSELVELQKLKERAIKELK